MSPFLFYASNTASIPVTLIASTVCDNFWDPGMIYRTPKNVATRFEYTLSEGSLATGTKVLQRFKDNFVSLRFSADTCAFRNFAF